MLSTCWLSQFKSIQDTSVVTFWYFFMISISQFNHPESDPPGSASLDSQIERQWQHGCGSKPCYTDEHPTNEQTKLCCDLTSPPHPTPFWLFDTDPYPLETSHVKQESTVCSLLQRYTFHADKWAWSISFSYWHSVLKWSRRYSIESKSCCFCSLQVSGR